MAETSDTSCSEGRLKASREYQNFTADGQGTPGCSATTPGRDWLGTYLVGVCQNRLLDKMLYPENASLKDHPSCRHTAVHSLPERALSYTSEFPPKIGTRSPCFHPVVSHRVLGRRLVPRVPISRCGPGRLLSSCCISPHVPPQASPGQCRWDLDAGPSTSPRTTDPLHSLPPGTPKPSQSRPLPNPHLRLRCLSPERGGVLVNTLCHVLQPFLCSNCLFGIPRS